MLVAQQKAWAKINNIMLHNIFHCDFRIDFPPFPFDSYVHCGYVGHNALSGPLHIERHWWLWQLQIKGGEKKHLSSINKSMGQVSWLARTMLTSFFHEAVTRYTKNEQALDNFFSKDTDTSMKSFDRQA